MEVEGPDGPQVDHLRVDPQADKFLRRLGGVGHADAKGDDRDIVASGLGPG